MSLFSSLSAWASKSTVIQNAEKQAIAAVSDAVQKAVQVAVQNAPGMQASLEQKASELLAHAIAGIATKDKT